MAHRRRRGRTRARRPGSRRRRSSSRGQVPYVHRAASRAVGRARSVRDWQAPIPTAPTRATTPTSTPAAARAPRDPCRPPQHRHRRPCRPRQDDARRRDAPPDRHVPGEPGRRRPGHGLGRSRAREGHHDPRQADDGRPRRDPPEHRRHARPRRLRRRGRALAPDGRRRAPPRRRRRGAAAPDPLRPPEGDGPPPAGGRRAQQDRPRATPGRPRSSTRSTSCSWTSAPTSTRSSSRSSTRMPSSARRRRSWPSPATDLRPLLDLLVEVTPPPTYEEGHPLQLLVTNLSANDYVGRMAVGRIWNGRIRMGQRITVVREEADDTAGTVEPGRIGHDRGTVTSLQTAHGIDRIDIAEAGPGDIVSVAGLPEVTIGDTITDPADPRPLPRLDVDAPTLSDDVRGQHLAAVRPRGQVRHQPPDQGPARASETLGNVSIEVYPTESGDTFEVRGRGELQLADPHRADAARGLRADRVAARGPPADRGRRDPGAVRADHDRHPARLHRRRSRRRSPAARAASSR